MYKQVYIVIGEGAGRTDGSFLKYSVFSFGFSRTVRRQGREVGVWRRKGSLRQNEPQEKS